MLLTTFLTTRKDWQRGAFASESFRKIWKFYESVMLGGFNATVIFDGVPTSVLRRYNSSRFSLFQADLNSLDRRLGINDVRFFLFRDLVLKHPEWRAVFLLDAFDIQVRLNPCPFLRHDVLYVGAEAELLKDNPWIVLRFHDLGGKYNSWFRTKADNGFRVNAGVLSPMQTLNCGILGGLRAVTLELLNLLTMVLSDPKLAVRRRPHQEINVDMAALNYVAHTAFEGRLAYGHPIHSAYKRFEANRTDVWFVHK